MNKDTSYTELGSGSFARVVEARGDGQCGTCQSHAWKPEQELIIVHRTQLPLCNDCAVNLFAPAMRKALEDIGGRQWSF